MGKITLECRYCNGKFEVYRSWKFRKCCSKKCDGLYRKSVRMGRERMLGKLNPMWRGGDSDKERRSADYKDWRIEVFKRDGFTCQGCGYFNGCGEKRRDLNAHHIVPWIESIELRYEVDNGKTLCVPCHIKEHQDKG